MDSRGYSTMLDVILFLAFVSLCAAVLGPVILSHSAERSSVDRGLREQAADTLTVLTLERVDYFEYRILGDIADRIASQGGLNTSSEGLYREMTRALLGRGSRHKTPTDLAAECAACQFAVRYGGNATRLNLLTGDYDRAANAMIDDVVRAEVDERYGYEYSLRWTPFAGVPLEGSVTAGQAHPDGAASAEAFVTMPYTTNVTIGALEQINSADLAAMDQSIDLFESNREVALLRTGLEHSLEGGLRNTTREVTHEIWNHTLGSQAARDLRLDPSSLLRAFSDNETLNEEIVTLAGGKGEEFIEEIVLAGNRPFIEALANGMAANIEDGTMDKADARRKALVWLASRYDPSRARVMLHLWVKDHEG